MNRQELIEELSKIVGTEDVFSSRRDVLVYEYDSTPEAFEPEVVLFPANAAEASAVMKLAAREGRVVVPRGAGTNVSGGTLPVKGGIVLGCSRMTGPPRIDTANERAVVEPGIINLELQNTLAPLGYLYAPDPASQKVSTLGGNVGENSGGPHCLKYGVTTNHVYGLEVVLADGQVIHTGGKVEDNPGYDLTGLMVASEGTLGAVTSMTLRLMRSPESIKTMLAIFDTLEDSSNAVSDIIAEGIIPATLEIMDKTITWAVETSYHSGFPLDAEGILIIELDGLRDGQERQAEQIVEICRRNHVREVKVAQSDAERNNLWAGRRGAFGAVARVDPHVLRPGRRGPQDAALRNHGKGGPDRRQMGSQGGHRGPCRRRQPPPTDHVQSEGQRRGRARPQGRQGDPETLPRGRRHPNGRARHRRGEAGLHGPPVRPRRTGDLRAGQEDLRSKRHVESQQAPAQPAGGRGNGGVAMALSAQDSEATRARLAASRRARQPALR